jgi:PAS domain S-box-containing protein
VCRRIKENVDTRDIPLVFLSGSTELPERVEGFRLGAVDFVIKPFQREELLARVRTHLELGRLRAHLEKQVAERTAELRESEERFRTMADAAPVMIWASGTDKLCAFVNKRWLEFTGRRVEKELGNGWTSGIHPDDLERAYATYCSAFDERRNFRMEYQLRRADGEYRWVLDTGVPRFSGGVFSGYVGSAIDITDLKQNQDRMVTAQKLESLGLMAAGVVHDFGNVLGTIFGEADLALSDMQSDSPGRENVQRIDALATYASEIVNLLRDSAGASVDSNAMEPIDLSSVVEQTLRLVTVSISKQVEVNSRLSRDLPTVRGNITQIRQIIVNLVTNAAEAVGDHEGSITIMTERAHIHPGSTTNGTANPPQGEYVRVTVSDTGCGMSSATRARIFDQFFTTKSSGRGLGLAAVHGIVRSHGGTINVVSKPGAGATFEVLFPCVSCGERNRPLPFDSQTKPALL